MKKTLFPFFVLILFLTANSQDFSDRRIASVMVVGNNITDDDVITREMLIGIGDLYNDSLVAMSEKRISNLFLFNHVEIIPIPDNQDVALLINVTERLYLFPFPEFRIEDRDWNKLTYGLGMAHVNFRGRNEKLLGIFLFGYRPGFELNYSNPWIGAKEHYTNSIWLRKYTTRHRTMDFDEDHFYLNWAVGRYWTRYFYTILNLNYDHIAVPKSVSPLTLSGKNKEDIVGTGFSINYDNRDLIAYPTAGWYSQLYFYKAGFFEPKIDYFQYQLDIRRYHTFGKLTFAARAFTLQSFGELPVYRKVYFGFNERLRGHFSEIVEGNHSFIGSFEVRFPLLPEKLFNLPSVFLPPSSTQNLKFGVNAALFYDSGIVWSNKNQLGFKNFLSGFGAGLHFRLPYIEVARLELAFDESYNSEIIFEVGTAL